MRVQVEAGVDVVNDGEMGKIGYSTYVKDRLTGFELVPDRDAPAARPTLADFPDWETFGRRCRRRSATRSPPRAPATSSRKTPQAVQTDIQKLKAAGDGGRRQRSCS